MDPSLTFLFIIRFWWNLSLWHHRGLQSVLVTSYDPYIGKKLKYLKFWYVTSFMAPSWRNFRKFLEKNVFWRHRGVARIFNLGIFFLANLIGDERGSSKNVESIDPNEKKWSFIYLFLFIPNQDNKNYFDFLNILIQIEQI